jgi:hypothetical protein
LVTAAVQTPEYLSYPYITAPQTTAYLSVIFLPQPAHSWGEVFFCVSVFTSIVILTPEKNHRYYTTGN